ncbi:MAG: dockerin type I domain-containing protein, partial [Candidatus Poribacteria bacterium]|nr:dockerin type I domain-containing protein [Candidatus Poribacteria bacterium]
MKPSDIDAPSQADIRFIRNAMIAVQDFFASEMDRHGFGQKTFDFNDEISIVAGKLRADAYRTSDTLRDEVNKIDWHAVEPNKIDVVFVAGIDAFTSAAGVAYPICWTWPGAVQDRNDCNYLIGVPIGGNRNGVIPLLAHEIGHTFGLSHTSKRLISEGSQDIMYSTFYVHEDEKLDLKDFGFTYTNAAFLDEWGRLSIQERIPVLDLVVDADINNDGRVDLSDVLLVRRAMQSSILYDTDVNNDGETDEVDVLVVKRKAMAAIVAESSVLMGRR